MSNVKRGNTSSRRWTRTVSPIGSCFHPSSRGFPGEPVLDSVTVASNHNGASLQDLLSLTRTLDTQSAREMREAIEEHCERVNLDEW